MAISSPGIGSNLDVNSIVAKLMQAESQPLTDLAKKEAGYQAKLSAFGNLSGSLSSFQTALTNLNTLSTFKSVNATSSVASILSATATSQALPGAYNINVMQLAQAQAIASAGQTSTSATIGSGASTTLTFQFGTINGGNYVNNGVKLGSGIASGGIAANSLTINGTTITTSSATNSALALANQINLATATTGVTATAQATNTGALGAFTTTSGAGTYSLTVGGVNIISNAAVGTTAADIDTAIAAASASLSAAGITISGTAAGGDLAFTKADGSNISVQESGAGAAGGFTTSIGIGTTQTFTSSVSLSSTSAITIGGSNPAAAGFTAGTAGTYSGAGFTQDSSQTSGSVTINSTNNSLQGIRDAINSANLGVTASIVSDGSSTPYHLVITSNKGGSASSMKISVAGDAALSNLLTYDPAGVQNMTQTRAAQNAMLTVNGIAVTSATNSVSGAIDGVTMNLSQTGSTTLNVAKDTSQVISAVNAMVKAYNDLNSMIKNVSGYDATTKQGGVLLGDSSVRDIQAQLRRMLSSALTGASGNLTTLSQVGISIDKTGVMSVDGSKLSAAMSKNLDDVAALFSSFGKTSDSLIKFDSATSSSTPGNYPIYITQLATQANVLGSMVVGSTVIDNTNNSLALTINGVTTSVTLASGTYTPSALAAEVQSAINGASAFSSAGIAVNATLDATGHMSITTNSYGSASTISVSGSGVAAFLGTPTATAGTDVAGTIGGIAASGSGQYLTGAAGSPAAGLKLQVTGGAINTNRGSINFSRGFAFQLNGLLNNFVGSNGLIAGRTDGLNRSIKDIEKQTQTMQDRLTALEARYRAQFTALDVTIGKMSQTSSYLTQQLAQISAISKSSSSSSS